MSIIKSIVMKKDEVSRHVIIQNEHALVISQAMKVSDKEMGLFEGQEESVNQVGIRYDRLDEYIAVLEAIRNAQILGVTINELWACGEGLSNTAIGVWDGTTMTVLSFIRPLEYIEDGRYDYRTDYYVGEKYNFESRNVYRFPEQRPTIISVFNHQRDWVSRSINHTALAVIEDYNESKKNELVNEVSTKVGYDPRGYCLYYKHAKVTPTGKPNEYRFEWQTADSCD